jgi:hypothetical protein
MTRKYYGKREAINQHWAPWGSSSPAYGTCNLNDVPSLTVRVGRMALGPGPLDALPVLRNHPTDRLSTYVILKGEQGRWFGLHEDRDPSKGMMFDRPTRPREMVWFARRQGSLERDDV